jgi:hypothetical protein
MLEVYERTEEWEDECCVIIGKGHQDEVFIRDEANARLIAAAPDLYDALDLALAAINDLYRERAHDGHCSLSEARQMYGNDGAVIQGRAALRKARGE